MALFDQARAAEAARNFLEAARLYDAILQIDPSLAEIWTNKGLALYGLVKYQQARVAFSKAASLKPGLLTPQLFLGILDLKSGEPQKALKHLLAASALDPQHPQVTYELANAYAQLEQFEKAVGLYRQLLARDPKMEEAQYKLGIAYLNWSKAAARKLADSSSPSVYRKLLLGDLLAVGGVLVDAEARYREAVEAQPNLVEARLALGRFLLDYRRGPGSFTEARQQFDKAETLAPGDPCRVLASAHLALLEGNYPEAKAHLEAALRADPALVHAHLQELLFGLPDPHAALSSLCSGRALGKGEGSLARESSAAGEPASPDYLEFGETQHAQSELDVLEEELKKQKAMPLSTTPRSFSRRRDELQQVRKRRSLSRQEQRDLALCAYQLGKYDEALQGLKDLPGNDALYWLSYASRGLARQAFVQAIQINPETYRAHLLLADMADGRHDTACAVAEFEKALALGPEDPETHLLLVQYLASKGQDENAMARAQSAVAKFPDHPALNCELGKLLLKGKNFQEAQRVFQHALDADRALTSARAGLADSYAALGETASAIREMKQALSDDPDGSYHYRLGRWCQKLGRSHEAEEAFAVSSELKQKRASLERERLSKLPE